MGRNRKDSTGTNMVDHYRKQIATEDTKKSKERLKNIKFQSDIKENVPSLYKDIGIMIGALLLLCICVYCIFYALLSTQ